MKIFYRYLYQEILVVSLAATGVLTLFLLIANAFRDIFALLLNKEVPVLVIVKLVCLLIPFILTFTLPWGLLLAVLLVFGRLSRDQELTSLKSSGIGLAPLIAPVMLLAFLFSLFSFWINASLAPRSREAFKENFAELLRSDPLSFFTTGRVIDEFDGFRLYVGERKGAELTDLHIWEIDDHNRVLRSIRAAHAEIVPDLPNDRILLNLSDAQQDERSSVAPDDIHRISSGTRARQLPLQISLTPIIARLREHKSVGVLTLGEIGRLIFDPLQIIRTPNMTPLLTELQKRLALSMASFTFVLVGIPLAIQAQRRETSVGLALSLGIVTTYYLVIVVAEALKTRTHFLPEIIIWMPNIVFEIVGFVLIIRANQR
ncbi:MAG: LptF/LptG family permease [Verrucomicrobium sp.]|nr:LptF/LptG family permease [Verrucomicrobium sp.]